MNCDINVYKILVKSYLIHSFLFFYSMFYMYYTIIYSYHYLLTTNKTYKSGCQPYPTSNTPITVQSRGITNEIQIIYKRPWYDMEMDRINTITRIVPQNLVCRKTINQFKTFTAKTSANLVLWIKATDNLCESEEEHDNEDLLQYWLIDITSGQRNDDVVRLIVHWPEKGPTVLKIRSLLNTVVLYWINMSYGRVSQILEVLLHQSAERNINTFSHLSIYYNTHNYNQNNFLHVYIILHNFIIS